MSMKAKLGQTKERGYAPAAPVRRGPAPVAPAPLVPVK
jgi:hypothetical protein